jgi:hypothetical protein
MLSYGVTTEEDMREIYGKENRERKNKEDREYRKTRAEKEKKAIAEKEEKIEMAIEMFLYGVDTEKEVLDIRAMDDEERIKILEANDERRAKEANEKRKDE